MSNSEVESYNNTFSLPSNPTRAYIFNKGYFSKVLLPFDPIENKRYCEIRCLLPKNTSNTSILCNKV